jgi:hypothetical protein
MIEKHLSIGTGIDQAAAGNISISLESTGYTQEQLFKAVEAAKDAIKKELDPR